MARSRKMTPIIGMTGAPSDKPFKVTEHRRERRAAKRAVTILEEAPHPKAFGNPWASEKDGKHWFDNANHPELMRK